MAARTKTKPVASVATLPNHPFASGTWVSFLPVHIVTVERSAGREPMAKPVKKARVKRDGTLEIPAALSKGQWCAAGPVGDRWRYLQFSVK